MGLILGFILVSIFVSANGFYLPNNDAAATFLNHLYPESRAIFSIADLGYRVKKFAWSDCGNSNSQIGVHSLSVNNDLKLSGRITLRSALEAPLEVDLTLQKKVIFWITLPCLLGKYGSCKFADVCQKIASSGNLPGDLAAVGLPSGCPAPAASYSFTDYLFRFTSGSAPYIPSFLGKGSMKAKVVVKQGGKSVGCVNFSFDLTDA